MYCKNCGGTLPDEAPFCTMCGARRDSPTAASSTVALPQPEGKAIASLVLGVLGLFFSIFAAIPAVIVGHKSYSEIRKSSGRLTGEGFALMGLVLGYFGIALFPVILIVAIPALMNSARTANEAEAAATVRTLIQAEMLYSDKFPKAGFARDLATLGPGGPKCASADGTEKNACLIDGALGCSSGASGSWCAKDAYKYSVVGIGPADSKVPTDFVITATPKALRDGKKSWCATSDGLIRFREGPPLVVPITTVEVCQKWEVL